MRANHRLSFILNLICSLKEAVYICRYIIKWKLQLPITKLVNTKIFNYSCKIEHRSI